MEWDFALFIIHQANYCVGLAKIQSKKIFLRSNTIDEVGNGFIIRFVYMSNKNQQSTNGQ